MSERQLCIYACLACLCLYHVNGVEVRRGRYQGRPTILPFGTSCSASSDCSGSGGSGNTRFPTCCRDRDGSLVDGVFGRTEIIRDPSRQGRCSPKKGGPGEVCNNACGCVEGYVCYRTITGACCPPLTCWSVEDAQRDKDFWANCKPPTCFFPPSAPPSGSLL